MKITSEIIQNNIEKLESLKKDFSILTDYENEEDKTKLSQLYSVGRTYGLTSYMLLVDFIRESKKNNQEVFYSKKISIKEFKVKYLFKNLSILQNGIYIPVIDAEEVVTDTTTTLFVQLL